MNNKAKELNLNNTHFVTPHGLDNVEHYTTAYELAILTDYALNNKKFAEIVSTKSYTININGNPKNINNTNELLGVLNGVNGVKTGFTNNAGRCLVTSTTRNNWQIISVVLGADTKKDRSKDSVNIIEYSFKNYELVNIKNIIENNYNNWKENIEGKIKVYRGKEDTIITRLDDIPYTLYPVKKTEIKNLKCEINNVYSLKAPINKNDIVGSIELKLGDKNICTVEIRCEKYINQKEIWDYFYLLFCNMGSYISCNIKENML